MMETSSLDGAGWKLGKYWLLGFLTTYPSLVKTSDVDSAAATALSWLYGVFLRCANRQQTSGAKHFPDYIAKRSQREDEKTMNEAIG
jgi:hypothetical protein